MMLIPTESATVSRLETDLYNMTRLAIADIRLLKRAAERLPVKHGDYLLMVKRDLRDGYLTVDDVANLIDAQRGDNHADPG
jgi:hypothetical protein